MWLWLIGTKTGRTTAMVLAIAVGAIGSWWAFSSHYETKGRVACEAKHLKALDAANRAQAAKNAANDATSAQVGQDAAKSAAEAVKKADDAATTDKGEITDVYQKPIRTAPVAPGSCVHPVDARVQDAIESATRRARNTP